MGEYEDSAWVFDSLVGFLQGPIWSAPLLTFIEEKSLIFEAETDDSKEYREIYQEYKNLVDLLLGCYMEDMGITPEQFEHACTVNKNTKLPVQFQQSLFEQIWAANEYEIFRRMMIQKNLELQLQALNMIEQKYGLTPASFTRETDGLPNDELVMEELLHKQMMEDRDDDDEPGVKDTLAYGEEHERLATKYHSEKVLLEQALKASTSASSRASSPEPEPRSTVTFEENLEDLASKKMPELKKLLPLQPMPASSKKSPIIKNRDATKELPLSKDLPKQSTQESPEAMKKREDYLKARRDKLVAMKKQARSQRLEMTKTRPGSAKNAAEASIHGTKNYEASQISEPSIIQVRKALAARLKAEVVGP